ncbi:hypothetical protein GCK72_004834 [Caenorhabditis remanei]|uniref:Uncharacterized protein n=1 Tax=Caenorhabditis remanei TaxID=31234 RepID=A0A6A5HEV6_CAERE|nr:hypothetical protein GCK72_004834 [Caenorhabditis remanei]KAF1764883.1 hypothetical protein GCK72_004834 [Caenorhabditis remanei]
MNWFIFLAVCLVLLFQEGQCCLRRRSTDDVCECTDFRNITKSQTVRDTILFTEDDGCVRNATCGAHYFTFLRTRFNVSELTFPSDMANIKNDVDLQTVENGDGWEAPTGPPVDLFSFFGIICENSKWYATKYPVGIEYVSIDSQSKYFGLGGEFDGKKSEIIGIHCTPPTVVLMVVVDMVVGIVMVVAVVVERVTVEVFEEVSVITAIDGVSLQHFKLYNILTYHDAGLISVGVLQPG